VHDAQAVHANLLSSCLDVLQLVLSLHSYILNLAHRFIDVRNLGLLSRFDTLSCHLQQKCPVSEGLLHAVAVLLPTPAEQATLMHFQILTSSFENNDETNTSATSAKINNKRKEPPKTTNIYS